MHDDVLYQNIYTFLFEWLIYSLINFFVVSLLPDFTFKK
jgi:hypothetical protein